MSPVHVFDHDIYTIVLGRTDADLTGGLKQVVADRRPAIPADILKFWKKMYPGYHVAFCCFNNVDAQKAAPMLWWYKPADPQIIVAPAIDGHDGKAPHPGRPVEVDHRLIASCEGLSGVSVAYSDKLSPQLSALLPTTVVGAMYDGSEANGDFLISVEALQRGDLRKAVTRGILPMAA